MLIEHILGWCLEQMSSLSHPGTTHFWAKYHTQYLLPKFPPTNLMLRHWELCFLVNLYNKFLLKSSVDERILEDGIKSFVKFKLHYIYFIPLIHQACHSVFEGNEMVLTRPLFTKQCWLLPIFCDRVDVCKLIFWWFVLVFSRYKS